MKVNWIKKLLKKSNTTTDGAAEAQKEIDLQFEHSRKYWQTRILKEQLEQEGISYPEFEELYATINNAWELELKDERIYMLMDVAQDMANKRIMENEKEVKNNMTKCIDEACEKYNVC